MTNYRRSRMNSFLITAGLIGLLLAIFAMVGCNSRDDATPEDVVAACQGKLLPRLLELLPANYDGRDTEFFKRGLLQNEALLLEVRGCRVQSIEEFARLNDNTLGHEAARVLDRI